MSPSADSLTATPLAGQPSAQYLMRQKRLDDAKRLACPDRVPVAPLAMHYYPNKRKGIPNSEVHHNRGLRHRLWRDAILEHDWDAAPSFHNLPEARPLELIGSTQISLPGGSLSEDEPFQFVEKEYMLQEEYDELLCDPAGFALTKLIPRVASNLGPLSQFAGSIPPNLVLMSNSYALPAFLGEAFSTPEMVSSLENLLALARDMQTSRRAIADYVKEMEELGYPVPYVVSNITAFDVVSDVLRGLRGSMLDMYRVPHKLLATVNMFIPWTVDQTVSVAKQAGSKGVFLALHRGAAGFMSDEQFDKFYWPGLKAMILGLLGAGITPIPFFEGDYTPRLKYLQELPPREIVGHFDKVDRRKAKEMIGDVMCFWGNVPASLLCCGTPQQVRHDVRELIEIFGDTGGLIVDGALGIPDEARPENVWAMREAVEEYCGG